MTIYTKTAWQKEGVNCAEAFARTLDPAHQQSMRLPPDYITEYSRKHSWITSGIGEGIGGHRYDKNQKERDRAQKLASATFVGFLQTGVLIASGHRSVMQDEDPVTINSSALNNLRPSWSKNCAMNDKVQERFGLCIFPLLTSPVAARQLVGLSLKDAFSKFVANDPEFLASVKREGASARYMLGYSVGDERPPFNRPGCFRNVSLSVPTDGGPVGFVKQEPEDNTARAARHVAMDRQSALFDLLRGGKIIASGHSPNGQRIDISPVLWQSPRCYVDFETGEFFQLSASDAPKLFASGVGLEAANPSQEEMTTAQVSSPAKGIGTNRGNGYNFPARAYGVAEKKFRVLVSAGERLSKSDAIEEMMVAGRDAGGVSKRSCERIWYQFAPAEWKRAGRPKTIKSLQ
jgi:hypothetical protein